MSVSEGIETGRFKEDLWKLWRRIAPDHVRRCLSERIGEVRDQDLCRVDLTADEVRLAVCMYLNSVGGREREIWENLSFEQKDSLLREVFPDTHVYGV